MPCSEHVAKFWLRESCHQSATSYRGVHPLGLTNRLKSEGARSGLWDEWGALTRFCDGLTSLQTCVLPCTSRLKERFLLHPCEAKLVWNASGVRLASWCKRWSDPPPPFRHRMHENYSFTIPKRVTMTCWRRIFEFFSSWETVDGAILWSAFCLRFKIMDTGFTWCKNPGQEGSSLSCKMCQEFGRNCFSSISCSTVRLRGTHTSSMPSNIPNFEWG